MKYRFNMRYDLQQQYRDLNAELLFLGEIDRETYFENEETMDEYAELYIINLN